METIDWSKFFAPYQQVVDELVVKMNGISNNYKHEGKNSPIISVSGRVKTIDSLLEKSLKKEIPFTKKAFVEHIDDVAGVRIICRFVEDIETIVHLIKARESFDIKVIKDKDFVSDSKYSGYRSYHLIIDYPIIFGERIKNVRAEIQIRTMAMDFWATIEHSLKYKYKENIPNHIQSKLIASANASAKLDKEMSKIREEILMSAEVKKVRSTLVNEIVEDIGKIFINGKIEEANSFSKEFIELYQEGTMSNLKDFNETLKEFNDQIKLTSLIYKK